MKNNQQLTCRCNNCMNVYDEDIKECPKCKTDAYLMQPYETKPQHTPTLYLPWKANGNELECSAKLDALRYIGTTATDELAEHIIKCVNNHFALLEALKEVQNKLVNYDFLQSTNNNQGRVRAVLSLTATALAKVEKG